MRTVPLGRLLAVAVTVIIVATAVAVVTVQYHTTTLVSHVGVVSTTPNIFFFGSRTPYQIALPTSLAGLFLLYAGYAFVVVRRTGKQAREQAEIREFPRREDESERRAA